MVTKCVYLYQYKTGNTIPKGWEYDSQGLGTRFPRAGNMIPKGLGKIGRTDKLSLLSDAIVGQPHRMINPY